MAYFQEELVNQVEALRRFALRLTRHRDEAEDLVQDCLLRAMEKRHLFQPGTNLRAWLFTMMSNLFISGKRGAGNRMIVVEEAPAPPSAQPSQLAWVELRALERLLAGLPAEQRQVVRLVAVEGRRYREAAQRLGIPVGTVRSRLARARVALANGLEGVAHHDRHKAAAPPWH